MCASELRDPIHGFIERQDRERRIIDTPVFQRLRRIRQLAMANLVYPGAVHTRFDHSIGVMHVTGRVAAQVGLSQDRVEVLRLAALLHDVGHGPFSHVSEDILEKYPDESKYKRVPKSKIGEVLSWRIIESDSELAKHLSPTDKQNIVGVLSGRAGSSMEQQIVSGPLDADKQDYVLRDSYFCGVKYGVFDIDRLIGTLERFQHDEDEELVGSEDGLYGIEQFVIAKYHLTWQVYRHKIRLITDNMIVRALELGIEVDKIDWLTRLYSYDGSDDFIKNFLAWDDSRLMSQLLYDDKSKGWCADLFRGLADRRLFKRVFNQQIIDISEDPLVRDWLCGLAMERNYKKTTPEERTAIRDRRRKLESDIAKHLSEHSGQTVAPEHVIVNQYGMKSVGEQARNKDLPIWIRKGRTLQEFEQSSLLFGSIDKNLNQEILDVYAPVYISDTTERKKLFAKLATGIREIFVHTAQSDVKTKTTEEAPHAHE